VGRGADFGQRDARRRGWSARRDSRRPSGETTSVALDVLRQSISVDVYTHGGKTGIT
jgi:hypothetical protein